MTINTGNTFGSKTTLKTLYFVPFEINLHTLTLILHQFKFTTTQHFLPRLPAMKLLPLACPQSLTLKVFSIWTWLMLSSESV